MKITISPWFWGLALLLATAATRSPISVAFWVVVVLISVLIHELGHALSAMMWGQKVQIELTAFGGVTTRQGAPLSPLQDFFIIAMGPTFGFLFALLIYCIAQYVPQMVYGWLYLIVEINVIWSLLNLLPVHPLDGGKLMAIILGMFFGNSGKRFSYFSSAIIAILFAFLMIVYSNPIVGALFLLFSFESFRAWKDASLRKK